MRLSDLYQQVILDHYRRPRNQGKLPLCDLCLELHNPTCGDVIEVSAVTDGNGRVTDIKFTGRGCSISQASASMMTEAVKGKTLAEAEAVIQQVKAMLRGEPGDYRSLGQLQSLEGVSKLHARVKCAALAWNVLEQAIRAQAARVPGREKGGPKP